MTFIWQYNSIIISWIINKSTDIIIEKEVSICKKYNIKYYISDQNIGISNAIRELYKCAKNKYFMFLECDWITIKNQNAIKTLIKRAFDLIENEGITCVRLRSFKNPGHPIHWISHYDSKSMGTELYLCTHYLKNPEIKYKNNISILSKNPKVYQINSSNCVFTNNPCIIKTSFYKKYISQFIDKHTNLEPAIDVDWKTKNFKIAITNGIFSHVRFDGHTLEGTNQKKNCCPIKYGGFSDNINCLCCIVPYKPIKFNKLLLDNNLDEDIDEQEILHKINKLRRNYFSNSIN